MLPTSPDSSASIPDLLDRDSLGRGRRQELWGTVAGVGLVLAFSIFYLSNTLVLNEADPRLLSEFRGDRPYQLRVLIPALLFGATHFLSLPLVPCYQLLIIGFCVGLYGVFRSYLGQFCPPPVARWLAVALGPVLLVFYGSGWFYLYDIPATFFATLGLLLMVQRRWAFYLAMFTVATLNRESSAFLALAFVLTMAKTLPRSQFAALLGAQAAIWLVIRSVLSGLFAGSGGKPVEVQFSWNMGLLEALGRGRGPLGFALAVLLLVALGSIGVATRRFQTPFLSGSRGVVVPFLALMAVVGVLSETRLYGELIPFLLAPALVGMVGMVGWNRERLGRERLSIGGAPGAAL
jgi:hypothetical protein